jgi:hypothetical protein
MVTPTRSTPRVIKKAIAPRRRVMFIGEESIVGVDFEEVG